MVARRMGAPVSSATTGMPSASRSSTIWMVPYGQLWAQTLEKMSGGRVSISTAPGSISICSAILSAAV